MVWSLALDVLIPSLVGGQYAFGLVGGDTYQMLKMSVGESSAHAIAPRLFGGRLASHVDGARLVGIAFTHLEQLSFLSSHSLFAN